MPRFPTLIVLLLLALLAAMRLAPDNVPGLAAVTRVVQGPITGEAQVLDGDTIRIGEARIRLHGIDAAEGNQRCERADGSTWDCAGAATERLRKLMRGAEIECQQHDRDQYDRIIAACSANGTDVQQVLVREGRAWAYRHFSEDYVAAEEAARREGIEIWDGDNTPPWEHRRSGRTTTASSQPDDGDCLIKGNINFDGERIYHTPESPWYDQPGLFTQFLGNGWRAHESSVESSCYTKPDSSPRSTPWVKRYSPSPPASTSPFASRAARSG